MSGLTIGRYEILKEIGQGGQSTAYKARDPKINRIVAIKRMRSQSGIEQSLQQEFIARFVREAQAAGRLSHPNIAVIYDVGDDMGEPYIAMEYIDGEHLGSILELQFPLKISRVVDLFCQLCEGLDYAHKNQIIHRDIKPANVMVTSDGQVKIVDFGIAKLSSSNLTQTGYILGTPSYMSPELIMGRAIDHRSDIFSVGVMLYETLAGQLPFVGHNPTTVIYKIVNEQLPPLFVQRPDLPARMEMIVNKALAKGPEQRYQSCLDLSSDLKQIIAPERFPAKVVSTPVSAGSSELGRSPGLYETIVPGAKSSPPLPAAPAQKFKPENQAPPEVLPPFPGAEQGAKPGLFPADILHRMAQIPPRWLIPGAALIGILFLFVIRMLVQANRAEENAIGEVPETTVITSSTVGMIEDMNPAPPTSLFSQEAARDNAGMTPGNAGVSTARSRKTTTAGPAGSKAAFSPSTTWVSAAVPSTLPVAHSPLPVVSKGPSFTEKQIARPSSTSSRTRIPAEHDHWSGSCVGTLIFSEATIEYIPKDGDHRFSFSTAYLRKFELKTDKEKSRLSIKVKDGKDYNFDIKDPDAIPRLNSAYRSIASRLPQ